MANDTEQRGPDTTSIRFPADVKQRIKDEKDRRSKDERRPVSTTDIVVDAVRAALVGNTGRLPVDRELGQRLRQTALRSGIGFDEFLQQALNQLVGKPYSPWVIRPGQVIRTVSDVPDTQEQYLSDMVQKLIEGTKRRAPAGEGGEGDGAQEGSIAGPKPAADGGDTRPPPAATVSINVPRALRIEQAMPDAHQSLMEFSGHLRSALRVPEVQVRVLFIDREAAPGTDAGWLDELHRLDRQFLYNVVGNTGLAERSDAGNRVTVQHATAAEIMGTPGRRSDRECLNQFIVFGDYAVAFTLETSLGMPLRWVFSRALDDVTYWGNVFERMWTPRADRTRTVRNWTDDP